MTETEVLEIPFKFRTAVADDVPFILRHWKSSYRESPPACWVTERYWHRMNLACKDIAERSKCLLAVDPDDEWYIVSYAVYEYDTLHYVYTRPQYRLFGIAKHLLDKLPSTLVYFSHATEHGGGLAAARKLVYKPSKAFPLTESLYWAKLGSDET